MRLMHFAQPRSHSSPLFNFFHILKIFDLVKVLNVLFIHKFLNSALPDDILNTFYFHTPDHNYGTRGRIMNLLARPNSNTTSFGLRSLSNRAISQWNSLQNLHPNTDFSLLSYSKFKSLITAHFLTSYTAAD